MEGLKVIGKLDIGAFPDYQDGYYPIENGFAIIDYMFIVTAYEDILLNLAGEAQAEDFLKYAEENDRGIFYGDGYIIEFNKRAN